MNVLISGATGLIGTILTNSLSGKGHDIVRLTRSPKSPADVGWDPDRGTLDAARLEDIDAVIHLAGESIAEGRWNDAKKRRILESREKGTRLLAETVAQLSSPPRVMISASAIGYYGDRGNELLREESGPGNLFLSRVCEAWEGAAEPARAAGIRVVHPRIGIVLSTEGGALGATLPIFKVGVGGRIGSGRQYQSWVHLDDVIGALEHALATESLHGPVNATAPNAPTNAEYTKVLGKVLGRPTVLPLPAPAARLVLGEMADELLLPSARVEPAKLGETGYRFRHPELEGAFRDLLGK